MDKDYNPQDSEGRRRRERQRLEKESTELDRKIRRDETGVMALDKQPGKSKREEFLRDSVATEFESGVNKYVKNRAKRTEMDAEDRLKMARTNRKLAESAGDTANYVRYKTPKGDYGNGPAIPSIRTRSDPTKKKRK